MAGKKMLPKRKSKLSLRGSYNFLGLCSGTLFFALSMLPSLLPRPWVFQALISGASFAIGYGLGVLTSFIIRWVTETHWPRNRRIVEISWRIIRVAAPIVLLGSLILGVYWQNQLRALLNEPNIGYTRIIYLTVVAFIVAWAVISIGRCIRYLHKFLTKKLNRYIPRRASLVLGGFLITLLFFWVTTGLAKDFLIGRANRIYGSKDSRTPAGLQQPEETTRSGSLPSLIPWETLGYQGKKFVAGGPTQDKLKEFAAADEIKQPIRVYVGLKSAATPEERAQRAVAELKRTGAFSRKVLVIANATGTGWLEPQSVDSLEYMFNGNSAIVSQQYSYLPSWMSFLVDKENATDAGTALFDAVHAEWAKMPVGQRPKLLDYGLSLGSYSGQAAFSGVNGLRFNVDGALFIGTPNDTRLWRSVTNSRDTGSPEWQPVYKNSQAVRFASDKNTIADSAASWQTPRILYVQHASDPIVWFNFNLLTHKPDWLKETRGPDVSPAMRWYPFITFAQMSVDQFFSNNVQDGHGHRYHDVIVQAWAAVANPDAWTSEKTQKLEQIIAAYPK